MANSRGVLLQTGASNTRVGGTAAGAANVLSGNTFEGVNLTGLLGNVSGSLDQGNRIGTRPDGDTALANGSHGVLIQHLQRQYRADQHRSWHRRRRRQHHRAQHGRRRAHL